MLVNDDGAEAADGYMRQLKLLHGRAGAYLPPTWGPWTLHDAQRGPEDPLSVLARVSRFCAKSTGLPPVSDA